MKRLLTLFRLKRDLTPDDVEARNEAKRMREDAVNLRSATREDLWPDRGDVRRR